MLKATSSPTVNLAVDHRLGAEQQQGGDRELADILNGVLALAPKASRCRRRSAHRRRASPPIACDDRLDGGGLDRLHADDRFDQELLAFRPAIELLL